MAQVFSNKISQNPVRGILHELNAYTHLRFAKRVISQVWPAASPFTGYIEFRKQT